MMNILFLSSHPTQSVLKQSGGRLDSLYRDPEVVIEGFRLEKTVQIDVITSPDIDSFPVNHLYYRGFYDEKDKAYVVSCFNVKFVKQVWTIMSMLCAAMKIVRTRHEETIVMIPYMVFRHVITAKLIKLLSGNRVKVCVIIPDIFFPHNKIFKIINKVTENIAKSFDYFVLYTGAMAEYLNIKNKKHIVIEGFHKVNTNLPFWSSDKFIVTYSGSLNKCYGICRLLDAMKQIPYEDVELHLYGNGDAISEIEKCANTDRRIKYHGLVPKERAMEVLLESTVLINPRCATDGVYVQYSFPSKDIDYLASGIPSILCKLPGMPVEYYGYFVDANDGSAESLATAICSVYNMSFAERKELAIKAQRFIQERMDIKVQIGRIIKLFNP